MYFLAVVQGQDGGWVRGQITRIRDVAQQWAMQTAMRMNAYNAVVVYGDSEAKVEEIFKNMTTGDIEKTRTEMELGDGGDHDLAYIYEIPAGLLMGLSRLVARFNRGEVGGENDGAVTEEARGVDQLA